MKSMFKDFWVKDSVLNNDYKEDVLSIETIKTIEDKLGYKLPNSYLELMSIQNGGEPANNCFPMTKKTSWADDHIAIYGFLGIGDKKDFSLCGRYGLNFLLEECLFPDDIGIYFATTPSGHEMICFDYRECGKDGEPKIIYVDEEDDYNITFVADNFECFIKNLVNARIFD